MVEYYDFFIGCFVVLGLSYDYMDGCMASIGDVVYMMGGWRVVGYDWFSVFKVEKFICIGIVWEIMVDMFFLCGDCVVVGLKGKVYVVGGYDDAIFNYIVGFKKNFYMYDFVMNMWMEKVLMKYECGDF